MSVDSRYIRIATKFWQDEKARRLSDDAKLLYLYVLTSPHSNMAGYYVLPKPYVVYDLQWLPERLDKALAELLHQGLIKYCKRSDVVLIPNFLKYNPIQNQNQAKGAARRVAELPSNTLREDFRTVLERYAEQFVEWFTEWFANTDTDTDTDTDTETGDIDTCAPDDAQEDTHDAPKESSSPKTIDELIDEATRYTAEQRAIIREYWDTVRFTRKRGAVAPSIVKTELEYWERFPPDIVLEALNIHLTKCRNKREEYTRGIMRRLQEERRNGGDFNHTAENRENHGRPGNRARTRTARTSACDYIGGKYGAIFKKERQAVHSTTSGSLDSE